MELANFIMMIAYVIMYWRTVVCVAGTAFLTWLLLSQVPWVSTSQGVAIALLGGMTLGLAWEIKSDSHLQKLRTKTQIQATSTFTAASAATLLGIIWGLPAPNQRRTVFPVQSFCLRVRLSGDGIAESETGSPPVV
jgi:hypothetical protein